jgi:hypothetical protein
MLKPVQNRRYWLLLMVQAFLFFLAPFTREHPSLLMLFILDLFGVFGTVIHTIWKAKLPRLLALGSAMVALVTGILAFPALRFEELVISYLMACCVAYAFFILIAIVSIGADVFSGSGSRWIVSWGVSACTCSWGCFLLSSSDYWPLSCPKRLLTPPRAERRGDSGSVSSCTSAIRRSPPPGTET